MSKVIKNGDYVPSELVFPPWGDGTYRVFKSVQAEDTMVDNFEDFPAGDHDDAVDASVPAFKALIKPPMRLRRWFNVMMLIINLVVAILLLLACPTALGLVLFGAPETLWDWLKYWAGGTVGMGCVFIGAFYFALIFNETQKGIRRNISIIRKNYS